MDKKTNVMIVDDDANFRHTLANILAKKGYTTFVAQGGLQALELVRTKAIDFILMDIKMPVMDGVETYKKLKIIKPGIKVILMSAFSVEDLIKDALKQGVYAVVRKPFDAGTIINMMEKSQNGAFVAIVDDDPNIGETMKSILEKKGYSVSTCLTGEEAIALARDRRQDIFCIDMKLPVLNGLETYLEIKEINPKAVVIMVTAYRQEADELVKQAIENGAYTCLYKPLDMDEVIKIIGEISKRMRQ